jgi:hypothetical protein
MNRRTVSIGESEVRGADYSFIHYAFILKASCLLNVVDRVYLMRTKVRMCFTSLYNMAMIMFE